MKWLLKYRGSGKSYKFPQIIAIIISSIGGLSFGTLYSWTSPAIPELLSDTTKNISLEEASYFTVISSSAMCVTSPCISVLMNVMGRKKLLFLVAIPHLIAWIITLWAENIWLFYIARFVSGVGDAAVFSVIPVYICELSEPEVRDVWGNAVTNYSYLGAFLINLIGGYNNIKRTAVIFGCLPLLEIILFSFLPESPYYLLMKNRDKEAEDALRLLRWRNDVKEEMCIIKTAVKGHLSESGGMKDLFVVKSNRKAVLICLLARFGQFFSGLPSFQSYTQFLFDIAGGQVSPKTSSNLFSGFLMICLVPSSYIIGKLGKRKLMIFSTIGCGIVLAMLAAYFSIIEFTNIDMTHMGWFPLTGMMVYVIFCSSGVGVIANLVVGELFSSSIKSKAVGLMNVTLAVFILIIPKLFQWTINNFGIYVPFLIFSVSCFLTAILSYLYFIETKGKSLEEIQQALRGLKKGNVQQITAN